jgi:predicted regulator of Ras-like GTPase activity (Roadblock/LC7/MglB family)
MSRSDKLNAALKELQASSSDIEACSIVSEDGLTIASALPRDMEEDRIAAMSAIMLSMGNRIANEMRRDGLEQLMVKGKKGYVILSYAGPHAVLIVLARQDAKLGLIFLDMGRAAKDVESALS